MGNQQTRDMDKNKETARRGSEPMTSPDGGNQTGTAAEGTMEQANTMARNVGEQARSMASNAGATAQDLARRAREQTDSLYEQGARAGEYLTRNVNEYPLTALLIAGAVGYGLGYLIHSSWSTGNWSDDERSDRNRNHGRSRD